MTTETRNTHDMVDEKTCRSNRRRPLVLCLHFPSRAKYHDSRFELHAFSTLAFHTY